MEWLNYHHLLYFWTVVNEGSVTAAGEQLSLAPSTISGQIRQLEETIGEKLFYRSGRRLVPTDVGQVAYRYADQIFATGRELMDFLENRPAEGKPLRFDVGIVDVVPKLVAKKLLQPVLELPQRVHLVCHEGRPDRLATELALHQVDVVLADAPIGPESHIKVFNHVLGECTVSIFGAPELAAAHRRNFPKSLDGAPMLLPNTATVLRRHLDHWFGRESIRPEIVGEFEDSALLKVFGHGGLGLFAAPDVVADEVMRQYQVERVGPVEDVVERFYAVSVERQIEHPAVAAIEAAARERVFG